MGCLKGVFHILCLNIHSLIKIHFLLGISQRKLISVCITKLSNLFFFFNNFLKIFCDTDAVFWLDFIVEDCFCLKIRVYYLFIYFLRSNIYVRVYIRVFVALFVALFLLIECCWMKLRLSLFSLLFSFYILLLVIFWNFLFSQKISFSYFIAFCCFIDEIYFLNTVFINNRSFIDVFFIHLLSFFGPKEICYGQAIGIRDCFPYLSDAIFLLKGLYLISNELNFVNNFFLCLI
jgi:hypothetical protein